MLRIAPGVLALLLVSVPAGAQTWQPGASVDLIRRAVAHRAARDADTLLTAWQAEAHGILRYISELDHGDYPVERVIRADELRVEVYGEAPNRSKQIILAWRDTTFLPNRLEYHRDHLGIVANDFGPTIRLGQGEEVRDVPHPLSYAGLNAYQFALGDTLVLTTTAGRVRVVTVGVRPVYADSMGAVGTLYLDIDRAALVRFRFTFTPASYRDRTVQDITVVLDNSLQQNTRWLPWRQSIVIRRGVPWIDFPVRTVIRADWTIDDYRLGVAPGAARSGESFIEGSREPGSGGGWSAPLARSLSDVPATDADLLAVERDAARALGGRLLDGLPRFRILAHGISELISVNRVGGITPALGARVAAYRGVVLQARGGIGLSDHRMIGAIRLAGPASGFQWSLEASRVLQDVADQPVISGVANSLGTLLSGVDRGDYTLLHRVRAEGHADLGALRASVALGEEWSTSVATEFSPISGTASSNPALGSGAATVARLGLATGRPQGPGWTIDLEGGSGQVSWGRLFASARGRIALPSGELQLAGAGGIATADLPGYRSLVMGGQETLPGLPFRSLGGTRLARVELAWALPVAVPTPPVPYARYARLPSTVAPFVGAGIAGGDQPGLPWRATGRIEPVAGLRLDLWGPLLRVTGGVSLRTGQAALTVDVHPAWWGLM